MKPQDQFARLVVVEVRRHHQVGRLRALVADGHAARRQIGPPGDLEVPLPVGIVPAGRGQRGGRRGRRGGAGNRVSAGGPVVVDAVRVLGEVRGSASRRGTDDRHFAAVGRDPDELGAGRAEEGIDGLLHNAPGRPHADDALAVGRINEVAVVRGCRREVVGRSAVRRHAPDVAFAGVVVPGHVRDVAPVRGPDRAVFAHFVACEPLRRPVRQVRDVHPVEGGEGDAAPVGRGARIPDLLDREGRRVLDRVLELDLGTDPDLRLDGEGDLGGIASIHRHPPDPPAVGHHQGVGVRGKGIAGEHVHGRGRLHVVALNRVGKPALHAGGQIAYPDARVGVVAAPVGQHRPVGGHRGPEGRAVPVGHGGARPRLTVVDPELELRENRVVLPRPLPLGVPHVPPFRVDRRAHHALASRPAHHLDSGAAVHVVQPQLFEAEELARPRHDDVLPIGHPLWRQEAASDPLADLRGIAARRGHEPDVLVTAPIGDEDDALAVRAEARLHVVPHPAGEASGVAPGDRYRVQVAEHVEDDRLAVRAHVERDPGALVGGEPGPAGRLQREAAVGIRFALLALGGKWAEQRQCDRPVAAC